MLREAETSFVDTETFLPALTRGMATLGRSVFQRTNWRRSPCSIPITLSIANSRGRERGFRKHPREIFWPVEGGVGIHSVFIHPLSPALPDFRAVRAQHFANIDWYDPRMFSQPDLIKIIDDPRQAYVNNFTAAGRLYKQQAEPLWSRISFVATTTPPGAESLCASTGSALPIERLDDLL